MWNLKWIIDVPVIVKIIVLVAGFLILAGGYFLGKTDELSEEKTDDNNK